MVKTESLKRTVEVTSAHSGKDWLEHGDQVD